MLVQVGLVVPGTRVVAILKLREYLVLLLFDAQVLGRENRLTLPDVMRFLGLVQESVRQMMVLGKFGQGRVGRLALLAGLILPDNLLFQQPLCRKVDYLLSELVLPPLLVVLEERGTSIPLLGSFHLGSLQFCLVIMDCHPLSGGLFTPL